MFDTGVGLLGQSVDSWVNVVWLVGGRISKSLSKSRLSGLGISGSLSQSEARCVQ